MCAVRDAEWEPGRRQGRANPGSDSGIQAEYGRNTSDPHATNRRAVPGLDGAEGFAHRGWGTAGRRERTQDDDHRRVAAAALWDEHPAVGVGIQRQGAEARRRTRGQER